MNKFKRKKGLDSDPEINLEIETEEQDDEQEEMINPIEKAIEEQEKIQFSMEMIIERLSHGLIASYKVSDDMNKPIFKPGDVLSLRVPTKILKKDFVFYKQHEEYFVRRVMKYVENDIYVAGDNEKGYHIIAKEDIIGKVLTRQRGKKVLSFTLNPQKKIYTFVKYNLSFMRLGKNVITYESEVNDETLQQAMQQVQAQPQQVENKTKITYDLDLDSELASFINPDLLVMQLREAQEQGYGEEDAVEYVEEYIEEAEEALALEAAEEAAAEAEEDIYIEEKPQETDDEFN